MHLKTQLIGLVSAFALVAGASATTTKIAAFLPTPGAGVANNPDVDGTGTIKFNAGTSSHTRVVIEISDLVPGTYGIAVSNQVIQGGGAFLLGGGHAVATNPAGHLVLISDLDSPEGINYADPNTVVTVFVWDGTPLPEDFDPSAIPDDIARATSVLR